jgi:hypothetical protein
MPIQNNSSSGVLPAILYGGFIAGTIDIGSASVINQRNPVFILKVVAGGLLGKSALHGDASVAVIGMLLQWAMSLLIATIFVLAARRMPGLLRRWIAAGVAYGVVTYFVMNDIVVPWSALGNGSLPHFVLKQFCGDMVAMILFGVIVAFFAQRFMDRDRRAPASSD